MATATVSAPVETHNGEYVLLHGVRWSTYEALLEDMEREGCRKRLTYDDGSLEIMTVSPWHEWYKRLIGRMIETMTEELKCGPEPKLPMAASFRVEPIPGTE